MLTLDVELVEQLRKEENGSALVNRLLKEHFDKTNLERLSLDQVRALIKLTEDKEALDKKIKEVENAS